MLLHLAHILLFAVAVFLTARIVPGIRVKSFGGALVFAVVLGIVDTCLHGVLVFLTFPFVLVTLGLFLFVINGFLWWLADKIVPGVETDGFGAAIIGSAVTSLINWVLLFFIR